MMSLELETDRSIAKYADPGPLIMVLIKLRNLFPNVNIANYSHHMLGDVYVVIVLEDGWKFKISKATYDSLKNGQPLADSIYRVIFKTLSH